MIKVFPFYMLPTRAWELLFGSLIWWIPLHHVSDEPRKLATPLLNLLALVFMSAILAVGLLYRSTTLFPGLNALAPVLCTSGLIFLHAKYETIVSKFLEKKPMVFIGLVSYSWYLWHWPLIAYANYIFGFEHSTMVQMIIVLASFGVACLSYWYIEQPFRNGRLKKWGMIKLSYSALFGLLLISSVDTWVRATDGAAFRIPKRIRDLELDRSGIVLSEENGALFKDGKDKLRSIGRKSVVGPEDSIDFLVWGDSHARMLSKSLESIAKQHDLQGLVAARSGSGPFTTSFRENSQEWGEMVFELIAKRNIRKILLVAKWDSTLLENRQGERVALQKLVQFLRGKGMQVGILLQVPKQKFDPVPAWVRSRVFLSELPKGISLEEYEKTNKPINDLFTKLSENGVDILDSRKNCFDEKYMSKIGDEDVCYYWDDDHLSVEGVKELLEPILLDWFEK